MLPVIEARALDLLLVEREAEGLDEMERGAGGETSAAGVSGVPVDLRLHEDDVDGHGDYVEAIAIAAVRPAA